MDHWRTRLPVDPIPGLLAVENPAIRFFVLRDLLGDEAVTPDALWELPGAAALVRRQKPGGNWAYPGKRRQLRSLEDYDQIETFRNLGILVEKFCFDRTLPVTRLAAEYLFSCQTDEGDFRGIYGQQYSPNYSAGIMELLIKAGYQDDQRIQRAFEWLLSIRQEDGGWTISMRTLGMNYQQTLQLDRPLQPDRSKPFSHLVTGVVLRAFAAHAEWRKASLSREIAAMLAGRFFKQDAYIDRGTPEYWERVSFPFWFTDIVSAMDSLSMIGMDENFTEVRNALDWLRSKQSSDGHFDVKILRGKDRHTRYWISLAICRIFKRYDPKSSDKTRPDRRVCPGDAHHGTAGCH